MFAAVRILAVTFCILDILLHAQTIGVSLPNRFGPLTKPIPSYPPDLGPLDGRLGIFIPRCSTSLSHFNRVPHPTTFGHGHKAPLNRRSDEHEPTTTFWYQAINQSFDQPKAHAVHYFPFRYSRSIWLSCRVASDIRHPARMHTSLANRSTNHRTAEMLLVFTSGIAAPLHPRLY